MLIATAASAHHVTLCGQPASILHSSLMTEFVSFKGFSYVYLDCYSLVRVLGFVRVFGVVLVFIKAYGFQCLSCLLLTSKGKGFVRVSGVVLGFGKSYGLQSLSVVQWSF